MSSVTVFCAPHWQTLEQKAVALWHEWRRNGQLPLVLVPTTSLRQYWLSLLAKENGGVTGDRVMPLDSFAVHLLTSAAPAPKRRALPLEERLAAFEALSAVTHSPQRWDRPGIVDAFLDAVEELELHGLAPENEKVQAVLKEASDMSHSLFEGWRKWKKTLREGNLLSVGDVLTEAAQKVKAGEIPLPPVSGVLVYGFTALTDSRWDFLMALLQRYQSEGHPVAFFVLANLENDAAYGYVRPFVERVQKELHAQVSPLPSSVPEELHAFPCFLFHQQQRVSKEPSVLTEIPLGLPTDVLADQTRSLGIQYVDLNKVRPDENAISIVLSHVPVDYLREKTCLPLRIEQNRLMVAMANPRDIVTVDELQMRTGLDIIPLLARPEQVEAELKKLFALPSQRVVCLAAAGEEQEIELVVRLLTHWRRKGELARWSDALLVLPAVEPYLPAIEAVSKRYGVPFQEATGEPLFRSLGLTNLLWAVSEGVRENWTGETLWQLLTSPHLRHPQKPNEPLLPPNQHGSLLQILRQQWVERGAERWKNLLQQKLDKATAEAIGAFLDAVGSLPAEAPTGKHARQWENWLQRFVMPLNAEEEQVLGRIRETLNQLKGWSIPLSLEEFVNLLTAQCRRWGAQREDAIQIAPINDAVGRTAPVVVLVGLQDGRFPFSPPMFEFLNDRLREKLTKACDLQSSLKFRRKPADIPFATTFAQEQRLLFAEILGIATQRVVLSYPRTDAEGEPTARSLFLDEAENALKAAGFRWRKEERDIADVALMVATGKQPDEDRALPAGLDQAIDQREAAVGATLAAFAAEELPDNALPFAASPLQDDNLRERLHTEWLRWHRPQEGQWDGKGLNINVTEWLQQRNTLYATALETYGKCPYQFFARYLLALEKPKEMGYEVAAIDWGTLWHKIWKQFLCRFIKSQQLPDEATLREIAQQVVNETAKREQLPPFVQEQLQQQVEKLIEPVWNAENAEANNWIPVEVEKGVQLPVTALSEELPDALRFLQILMRIDRVDKSRNQQDTYRVVDYKTGDPPGQSEIRKGIALQLPFYALALYQQGLQVVEAEFLHLSGSGYSHRCQLRSRPHRRNAMTISEALEHAKRWGKQFILQIASSDFTVLPQDLGQTCRRCDYRALCRRHRLRLKERGGEGGAEEEG